MNFLVLELYIPDFFCWHISHGRHVHRRRAQNQLFPLQQISDGQGTCALAPYNNSSEYAFTFHGHCHVVQDYEKKVV